MFTIGLEMKLENLIQMRKQVFVYCGLPVGLSILLFTSISYYLFSLDIKSSLVRSGALSLSSTAIVLKILNDTNNITNYYIQNSLGILIFQDLAVIPILLVLTILSTSGSSVSDLLVNIVFSGLVLLIVMVVLIIAIGSSF